MLIAKTSLATIALQQEALAIARQQLADTSIRVPSPTQPVPGVEGDVNYAITHRAVAEGSLVQPGMELFELVIEQPLELRGPVLERHRHRQVRPAQAANQRAERVTVAQFMMGAEFHRRRQGTTMSAYSG